MNEPRVFLTKQIHPKLDNPLQFRISKIKETEEFFIGEVIDREKTSKALNKYITISW